jgi:hypothetical protein
MSTPIDPAATLADEYENTICCACRLLGVYSARLGNGEQLDPAAMIAELRAALGAVLTEGER